MNPVSLPMLHLLSGHRHIHQRSWDIGPTATTHAENALVLMREYFDKPGQCLSPVIENPCRTRASRKREMLCYKVLNQDRIGGFRAGELNILRFNKRLQVDGFEIAALFGEVSVLVKYVSDAATHAGSKISAARSEPQHHA